MITYSDFGNIFVSHLGKTFRKGGICLLQPTRSPKIGLRWGHSEEDYT